MSSIPVVRHFRPRHPAAQVARVDELAASLVAQHPWLVLDEVYDPLVPESLGDEPTLHLDDLSGISLMDRFYDVTYLEDRARLRASDGDIVASCSTPNEDFEHYCSTRLELGSVEWIHPSPSISPLRVASACWTDRSARLRLLRAMQTSGLRYIHPHMGNFRVWATALLFRRASGCPLVVIAPPPGLTRAVNDKVWFAKTVARLLGDRLIPRTAEAWSFSTLAHVVRQMSRHSHKIVVKVPDSAGGAGNLVLPANQFHGMRLGKIRATLRDCLRGIPWYGEQRLLVGAWETDVLSAPSAQLWIPPRAEGPPVVEGLYEQVLEGSVGFFVGSKPAEFSTAISQYLVDQSWLLALLFQRLGYIGRCSFDMLLVGEELETAQLKFVECNGRWGGTSGPMTLMNRIFRDWTTVPYATQEFTIDGLETQQFNQLLDYFDAQLFDARTGRGSLILYNPGALQARPGIDVIAIGDTWEHATELLHRELPSQLRVLARQAPPQSTMSNTRQHNAEISVN